MKIYKNRKRIICIALCCVTLVISLYYAYDNPKEVKAIAVVDDIAIVLAILAACGVGYVGYEWFNQSDIAGYADDVAKAEETLGRLWDNAVNQFSGGDNPDDFDPDNDDPNEKPPKWEKLKAWAKAHPGATLALGAGGALASVVTTITPEILKARDEGKVKPENISLPNEVVQETIKNVSDYPYIYSRTFGSEIFVYMTNIMPLAYKYSDGSIYIGSYSGTDGKTYYYQGSLSNNTWILKNEIIGFTFGSLASIPFVNFPIYESSADADANYKKNGNNEYLGTINPASLPLSTDIMDWLDQNPGKDAPDQSLYDNVKIPTQEEVDTFIQDLNKSRDDEDKEDEQQRQTIANEFIQNITNVNPEPNPDPGPGPTPDPDPGTDPDPDPNPKPDPTPEPELDPGQLEFDFKLLFPFCIPFDLIDALEVLDAEPVAPAIDVPIPYMSEKGMQTHTIKIDLSEYDSVALLLRRMEVLLFIVGLILITRNLIRG